MSLKGLLSDSAINYTKQQKIHRMILWQAQEQIDIKNQDSKNSNSLEKANLNI